MINEFSPIPEGIFGTSGLTATRANYIANLLKMKYETLEGNLSCLQFVEEKIQVLGTDKEHVTKNACVMSKDAIINILNEIARYKGFIAYLREAIKCKDNLMKEIQTYRSKDWDELAVAPDPGNTMTMDEAIASMTIGERVAYLTSEARAATFGKFVHPGGILYKLRDAIIEAFAKPTSMASTAHETVMIKRKSALGDVEIDSMMASIQEEQRKSEAELNGYKHALETKVNEDTQEKLEQYRVRYAEYEKKRDELLFADRQARTDRMKVIEGLKIVIPNCYRDLYDRVNG